MAPDDLTDVALDLFEAWISGQRRFPTLSQQNQDWYRAILVRAGKTNPTRDDLKAWFNMPHGTAQYLAGVFYDPVADTADQALRDTIVNRIVDGIVEARKDGVLGAETATVLLTPKAGRALESLVVAALADNPMTPPSITKLMGTARVTFSSNEGLDALCLALGPEAADRLRTAAGAQKRA
jgi:hypothetical protein